MLIYLEKKLFTIGRFSHVVNFLSQELSKQSPTQVILPCSLNDLAINQVSDIYKNVDYFTNDSMFLTWFFRIKHYKYAQRVYGPDLLKSFLMSEQKNSSAKKHYFLAANKYVAHNMDIFLAHKYPKLNVKIEFLPHNISKQKEQQQLSTILKNKPEIIWLGIGSPKQIQLARWLKQHSRGAKVFCVGAAFDFVSGNKYQSPQWMQYSGLEWFFRLITEPRRLWRRYLINIPKYLIQLAWRQIRVK